MHPFQLFQCDSWGSFGPDAGNRNFSGRRAHGYFGQPIAKTQNYLILLTDF
jgi:hypothetical protein